MPFSIKKLNLKLPAVSMKVPLFLLLLGMGFLPMVILGKMMTGSFMQTQIDPRMIEVQNQGLITRNWIPSATFSAAEWWWWTGTSGSSKTLLSWRKAA